MSDPSYLGQSPVFGDFPSQVITATGVANYTMNFKASGTNGLLVFINGSVQRPGIDFSAGGNQLLFTEVVPTGAQIFVYGLGLSKSSLAPSMGSVGNSELESGLKATSAEVSALTSTDKLVTPASLVGLPLTKVYESTGQVISSAGLVSLTHGLGKRPPLVFAELLCTVAEHGFSVGDVIQFTFPAAATASNDNGVLFLSTTTIGVRFGSATNPIMSTHKTTGAQVRLTSANWLLVLRAYA